MRTFNINIASIDDLGKESYISTVVKEEVPLDELIKEIEAIENDPKMSYDFIVMDINP